MPIIPDSRIARIKTPTELMLEKQNIELAKFISNPDDYDVSFNLSNLTEDQKNLVILQHEEFLNLRNNEARWIIENLSQLSTDIDKYRLKCVQILSKNEELPLTDIIQEWNYIVSDANFYEGIIQKLNSYGLLFDENKICDCGIGLGETLFNIYDQTKEITTKKFEFYGIEKNKFLYNSFNQYLRSDWEKIELIEGDIMQQNLSQYNIIYTYTPFKLIDKLSELYLKIVDEMPIGGVLLENFNKGLGIQNCLFDLLKEDYRVEIIDLDGIIVYQKV